MKPLTGEQLSRQDRVDGAIFKMLHTVNPTRHEIPWDIEMIGDIRDTIEDWLVSKLKLCSEHEFYPFIEEHDGNQRNSN
jgi:hypothetical protein